MSAVADVICIVLLALIAAQDFKSRLISWWLLPLLIAALTIAGASGTPVRTIGFYFLVNSLLLGGQVLLIMTWFAMKNRKWTNIVNTAVGLGDLLFLLCIAAAFSPLNFIAVYVAGLTLTLLAVLLIRALRPGALKEIPLAGTLSLLMIGFCAWRLFSPGIDFYSDTALLNRLTF